MTPQIDPIEHKKISDSVYETLRNHILHGKFQPGDRLPAERDLCISMNVNRSSVREALKRLEQTRLIEVRHGNGSFVLDYRETAGFDLLGEIIAPENLSRHAAIRGVFELRSILLPELARLAALRAKPDELADIEAVVAKIEGCPPGSQEKLVKLDFDFHYAMSKAAGNLALLLLLNSIKETYFRNREFLTVIFEEPLPSRAIYRQIFDAVRGRDGEKSKKLCSCLIEDGNNRYFKRYNKIPTEAGIA